MKKMIKRIMLPSLAACLIFGLVTFASAKSKKPVSPALNVIAASEPIVLSAEKGDKISFSADALKSALGTKRLDGVLITSLPSKGSGKLTLGSLTVTAGQRITASSLSSLVFTPNSGTECAEFCFSVGGDCTYKAVMYFLDEENYSPTSAGIDESFFSIKTYKNIAVSGTMRCVDPEGDKIKYEVVSYPEKGLMTFKDRESGEYTYTPMKNYVGNDSFSYVAVDKYGNRSAEITVDISVDRSESGIVFKDMIFDPAHYGAILLDSMGIMKGREDEGDDVFMPEKNVSYGEFIKTAMIASDIDLSDSASGEIAGDIMALPSEYRSYILTAYDLGLINTDELKDMNCDKTLTKAEACVIVDTLIGAEDVRAIPVFDDIDEVPDYALSSVCSLLEIGVIRAENRSVSPTDSLTRADAAEMLAALINRK